MYIEHVEGAAPRAAIMRGDPAEKPGQKRLIAVAPPIRVGAVSVGAAVARRKKVSAPSP